MPLPATLNLGTLNGLNGFRIDGGAGSYAYAGSWIGWAVAAAGDVNGDGIGDLLLGDYGASFYKPLPGGGSEYRLAGGIATVIFGKAGGWASTLSLPLGTFDGIRFYGGAYGEKIGVAVAGAGDVNGDGQADLLIGAPYADPGGRTDAGSSFLVLGLGPNATAGARYLDDLLGGPAFRLDGVAADDNSGWSVAAAGDVNGDGIGDLIIGAPYADPGGRWAAGSTYLVFGTAAGWGSGLDLGALTGSNGVRLDGVAGFQDESGWSVAGAGDVNGDGLADLFIGAPKVDLPGKANAGAGYVVFGKATGWAPTLNLGTLTGSDGFRLTGAAADDMSGTSVAAAGDVNGDGIGDLIIGAYAADPSGRNLAGASYVVFGKASGWAASLDLGTLTGSDGFRLTGPAAQAYSGFSVAAAGDVNGDGYADLIVGAYRASPAGRDLAGSSFLVYGKASGWAASLDLGTLTGSDGVRLDGAGTNPYGDWSGYVVTSAGDLNGDWFADLAIGAPYARPTGTDGAVYVVFGEASGAIIRNGTPLADRLAGGSFDDQLAGLAGADSLRGNSGADTLGGGAGYDTLDGGAGSDSLDGGGGRDWALYSFASTGALSRNADGSWRVAEPGGSADTLRNIERIEFSDRAVVIKQPNTTDVTGDGLSDTLLQNTTTGEVYAWGQNGIGLINSGFLGWTPGANWRAAGAGDANGDGFADVLLQDATTGACYLWSLNGALTGAAGVIAGASGFVGWTPGTNWRAFGMGDVNDDGRADALLQNTVDGSVYAWMLNGTALVGSGYVGWTPGAGWRAAGIGDFNGDGKSDIALQNATTGEVYLWLLNGTALAGHGYVGWRPPSADWRLRDTGDYNGDGRSDILLQDAATGDCYAWLVDGTTVTGSGFVGWRPGAAWVAQRGGDVNGDGNGDVLLRNGTTGESYIWTMSGTSVINSGFTGWATSADWQSFG